MACLDSNPARRRPTSVLALMLTLSLTACPDASPADPAGSSSTSDPAESSGDTNPVADTTSTPDPTVDPTTSGPDPDSSGDSSSGEPPAEPAIHWVGRWDHSDPTASRAGWSGIGLVVRFDGTAARVQLDDDARYFTVLVDGVEQPVLATSSGSQLYDLATGLPAGEHTVELYRRTEGSFGPTVVHGVELDGELLPPPPVTRRIEVIGDSITAGYGNEGVSPCGFSAETENHYQTYGAIAARSLGAELHTVAWSGKGVVYNYGDDVFEPMPEIYDRLLATEGAAWDFSWQPDVVVINLGTNDFSTGNDPSAELFTSTYVGFLAHLRDVYPQAFILAVSPSLFGGELTMVEGYLQDAIDQRMAAGDTEVAWANINVDWIGSGCDGHPTVATHQGMGARLVEELQSHLGW